MSNIENAKTLVKSNFNANNILILADIYPRCIQLRISEQDFDIALQELEVEGKIRIEKLRPLFWEQRVISLEV